MPVGPFLPPSTYPLPEVRVKLLKRKSNLTPSTPAMTSQLIHCRKPNPYTGPQPSTVEPPYITYLCAFFLSLELLHPGSPLCCSCKNAHFPTLRPLPSHPSTQPAFICRGPIMSRHVTFLLPSAALMQCVAPRTGRGVWKTEPCHVTGSRKITVSPMSTW